MDNWKFNNTKRLKGHLSFLTGLVFSVLCSCVSETTFYVSPDGDDANPGSSNKPYKTIQKAIDASVDGSVNTILLKEGVYELDAPVVISPKHSENKEILKITNLKGDKVVISGGKEVKGWELQENGWWVTEIPEVLKGKLHFRQLYVNGDWRQRAKMPNTGFYTVKSYGESLDRFEFAEGDMEEDWKSTKDAEVTVYHYWNDYHLPIKSIDDASNIVSFSLEAYHPFKLSGKTEDGAIYSVENIIEALDVPGEWFLDKETGRCYYFPFPEEKIEESSIVIPVAEQLIRLEGDALNQQWVKNIQIVNIDFCFTNFNLPEGNANHWQASYTVSAAIFMTGSQNCSISHCRFSNLGNFAVDLSNGCLNNTLSQNEVVNVAAGGFKINGGNFEDNPILATSYNQILYNHIHNYGKVYSSAVGILVMRTNGNRVAHNLIHHGYYSAISVGWDWGYHRSVSRDNIIEFNHLHHIGQGLISDMGAIYTLGVSPGTVLRNNLIHDVEARSYGGFGIYHDEASNHVLDEFNIVYNTEHANFDINDSKEVYVRNNIFALGESGQIRRFRVESHKSVFFEKNIIYWRKGDLFALNWHDIPYESPYKSFWAKGMQRSKTITGTFHTDYNIYYNPEKSLDEVDFNGNTWDEWHALGKDIHSLYADPLFVDPDNYDFRLKENSPAFAFGFIPIDMEHVGLDGKPVGPVY